MAFPMNVINCYFHRLKSNSAKCHAVFGDMAKGLVENSVGMEQFQSIQSGIVIVTEGLSDMHKWIYSTMG